VADQEERLDRLTALVEAAAARPPGEPPHRLVHPPAPANGSRWRKLAGRLLRAPGAVFKKLRKVAGQRWILPVAEAAEAPQLRLGEDVFAIELHGRLADLPPGYRELASWVLAAEGLFFVELRGRVEATGPDLELWLCRRDWPWRKKEDMAQRPSRLPAGGPLLGRRILLDVDQHSGLPPAGLAGLEVRDQYWLRPGAPAGIRHGIKMGRKPAASAGNTAAIVATRPLDGGLEVLAARALRSFAAEGRQMVLAATFDLRSSHRSLAEVAPREVELYPLATFSAPEVRGELLARLLEQHEVGTILQIGPGEGFFDQPALQEILRRVRVIDLPVPPITLGRPPGIAIETLNLEDMGSSPPFPPLRSGEGGSGPGSAGVPPAPALKRSARERLGLPEKAFVACQMADLVPAERPEDLVELAHRCPGVFFLQVGRGGLAGRRDDLARFRGVANLRTLPAAELAEVLAAADLMLALGEPSPWPWPIFAALEAGVPVAGRAAGALSRFAGGMTAAGSLAELAAAVEKLRQG
jgi:hypothetical protein